MTISDFVSGRLSRWRKRGSERTSLTSTCSPPAAAAPISPWPSSTENDGGFARFFLRHAPPPPGPKGGGAPPPFRREKGPQKNFKSRWSQTAPPPGPPPTP